MGISTHILDTALGHPADEISVSLVRQRGDGSWGEISSCVTDVDGRCRHLLQDGEIPVAGIYRLRFETAAYFARFNVRGLYPYVDIIFEVTSGEEHYHIPLLLTPNGYTTYRGS